MAPSHFLSANSGDDQVAIPGTALALPLVTLVRLNGVPTAGVVVTFTDNGAGGSFGTNPATSDGSGLATTTYTLPSTVVSPFTISITGTSPTYTPVTFTVNPAGANANGKFIVTGSSVTVIATVVSVTGTGSMAQVTAQPIMTDSAVLAQANDMVAAQQPNDASHPAVSIFGKSFGKAGDQVSILGTVSSIAGSGSTASLTITLKSSGASITVPAGACQSGN